MDHKISIITVLALAVYFVLWLVYGQRLDAHVSTKYHGLVQLGALVTPFLILMLSFFYAQRSLLFSGDSASAPGGFMFLAQMVGIVMVMAGICAAVLFVFWSINEYRTADVALRTVLDALFILVGIAILYKLVSSYLSVPGWKLWGPLLLIKEVLLYIPCMILSLGNWVKYEYKITTKPVWILLGIEVAIIALRFFLPWLLEVVLNHEGKLLLKDPVYLNTETTIGTFDALHRDRLSKTEVEKEGAFNYNYAISGWFYVNPQPPGTSVAYAKDTSILNYGGKPNVTYNGKDDTIKITVSQQNGPRVDGGERRVIVLKGARLPLQKWNHIVLNMKGGMLDVFLNGKLIAS
ncbi:MAG: hypothetical protein KAI64_06590, partial [Thermoplasmata archaeon]|nr:hypothetical protein [Thermoplasmata archaeon]